MYKSYYFSNFVLDLTSEWSGGVLREPRMDFGGWVSDRLLGGREVWVEDAYDGRPRRGNALGEDLTISPTGGLSEKAAIERRKEEARAGLSRARECFDLPTRFLFRNVQGAFVTWSLPLVTQRSNMNRTCTHRAAKKQNP